MKGRSVSDRMTEFFTTGMGARVVDGPHLNLFFGLLTSLAPVVVCVQAGLGSRTTALVPSALLILLAPVGGVLHFRYRGAPCHTRSALFLSWFVLLAFLVCWTWLAGLGSVMQVVPVCGSASALFFFEYGKQLASRVQACDGE